MEKLWILSLIGSLAWVAAVMLAFAGIGDWILRCSRHTGGWIASFVCGLCGVVSLGGWLNFLHGIRPAVLIGIVAIGVVLGVMKLAREGVPRVGLFPECEQKQLWVVLLFACCCALIVCRLIATVHRVNYHPVDDLNEYLVFPQRMLQKHFFAADPFSERRLINSVGPTYFVQSFIVAVLPLTHLQMADETIGMVLLAVCLIALAKRWKLSSWATGVALLLSFLAIQSTFNLSFSVLPGSLLLAMVLLASSEDLLWSTPKLAVLLGAIAGVVCGLKTTYLPHAALLAVALCGVRREEDSWVEKVCGWFGALIGFLLVLGPWMVAMRQTSGTFLYPIFGQGVHYPLYYKMGTVEWKAHSIHDVVNMLWLLPVLAMLLRVTRHERSNKARMAFAFLGGTTLAAFLLAIATVGDSVMRYSLTCVFPALVIALMVFLGRRVVWSGAIYTGALLLVLVCVMGKTIVQAEAVPLAQAGVLRRDFIEAFRPGILPDASMRDDYVAMETAIPEGQRTLAVLTTPYYLDFAKRQIYLSELTAAASPAPGWPIYGSGQELAAYLRGQSIRYLAYSYADGAGAPDSDLHTVLASGWTTTIVRNEMLLELEAHRQFHELASTRKHVYDDGKMYLLDLDTQASK